MSDFLTNHEPAVRLTAFLGVLLAMGVYEQLAPRRPRRVSQTRRWLNNLALVVLNSLVLRVLFPAAAVGAAVYAQHNALGLLPRAGLPPWLMFVLAVVILDFLIWLQHVMVHAIPVLWRLHRVHHADVDFDVTTALRFHPLEIILSMLIKFAAIILLGAPVAAVIVFEVLLNATAMFNHANARLPESVDRWLRWLVVTPDMHRVHHSVEDDETNSNFGFNLPWWDRLFGTYRDQPRAGHEAMRIGIHGFQDPDQTTGLGAMLRLPFVGKIDAYVLNRRSWPK